MSKLLISFFKQDGIYLVFSCFVFPLSLKISLLCFTIFIVRRVLFFDCQKLKCQDIYFSRFLEIALAVAFTIAVIDFYYESRIQFYPVSYYDYLLFAVVAVIIKLHPLEPKEFKRFYAAFALSPLIIFLGHLTSFDFQFRNHWGFDNSNALGLYCAICLPLIVCQLFFRSQNLLIIDSKKNLQLEKKLFLLDFFSLIICWFLLISSGSRSSFYTSSLIFLVVLLIYWKSTRVYSAKYYFSSPGKKNTFLFIFSCLGIVGIFYKFILSKFIFIRRFINLTNSTNIYRTYVYKCYWNLGLEKPWWGWGIDKTSTLCEEKLKARYGGVNHAHNFILQIFADSGTFITFICLIALGYFIIFPSFKFIVNFSFGLDSILYLGICLSCLSILIVSLFQSSFYHYPLFPLWLGLLSGSLKNSKIISS